MADVKKITRKVISKVEPETAQKEQVEEEARPVRNKKGCFYCQNKTVPDYTDLQTLRRFLSDRSKIVPKLKSNLCSKHQRFATRHIKYARHLGLLPFTPAV
ncbi:30S ribosomal protein S18 [Candidatus Daviesbacteria bacterium]|nr:30S ribosomal protein S18 [Candidatus Daviesbacteria bacterium]